MADKGLRTGMALIGAASSPAVAEDSSDCKLALLMM
jgi:hypothetical protein